VRGVLENECLKKVLDIGPFTLRAYQRRAVEEVYNLTGSGGVVVAELPTGYGKTLIPVLLTAALVSEGLVSRVIHTYPATSMIEHLVPRKGKEEEKVEVRALRRALLECMDLREEVRQALVGVRYMFRHESPLLTNPYVITTLDTLVAHYLKTTFTRALRASGRGTYSEFSAGVIHSSLLVFDEAHMYPVVTEEKVNGIPTLGKAFNVMAYIMGRHAEVGGVSLIMTATLPEPLLHGLKEVLARYGVKPKVIKYDESEDDPPKAEWSFRRDVSKRKYVAQLRRVRGRSDLTKEISREAVNLAMEGKRVLVVLNTVRDAVRTYSMVKSMTNVPTVLAHSRFTVGDREEIVSRIKRTAGSKEGAILVATQVVEASIDISMDALLTDAAPLDSIAQRVGRVCRSGHMTSEECVGDVRIFYAEKGMPQNKDLYGPYDIALVKASLESLKRMSEEDFNEFSIKPREWISEAYSEAYAPVLLPNDKLLDFLEGLTIRTSPALIEEWAYEEFGGFVRNEDLAITVLVNRNLINSYLKEPTDWEQSLREAVRGAVRRERMVKVKLGILINMLKKAGMGNVPLAWIGLEQVSLREADLSNEWFLRVATRAGAYVVIPEELYDSELGLIHPVGGDG